MENMKSESKNPALEAALTMKSTMVADLEASIHEFEGTASLLDRRIKAEEARTRIEDPTHFAYSNFAKSAISRLLAIHLAAAEEFRDAESGRSGHLFDLRAHLLASNLSILQT
jgi:hypothetical protein